MQVFEDFEGRPIRLPAERLAHIVSEHATMAELGDINYTIRETLAAPDTVVESRRDPEVRLYVRRFEMTAVVVVAIKEADAFILTAYASSKIRWQS